MQNKANIYIHTCIGVNVFATALDEYRLVFDIRLQIVRKICTNLQCSKLCLSECNGSIVNISI